MNHSFNVDIAKKYGMFAAVLLEYLDFWVTKNKANDAQFYDGYYWTYNSTKALTELFPYVSRATISRTLSRLEEEGLILSGNYNKSAYDRTIWYTLTEKGALLLSGTDIDTAECGMDAEVGYSETDDFIVQDEQSISQDEQCISQNEQSIAQNEQCISQNASMDLLKTSNGFAQSEQPIPFINTVIDTVNNITVSDDTVRCTAVQRVVMRWNALIEFGIKPVKGINQGTKRYDMLKSRIRTYGIEQVLEAIENIKKSLFLRGNGSKGWIITFDWFVRPNNFIKVLEGNYDDHGGGGGREVSYKARTNQFNSFSQRDYNAADIDSIEKRLLAT